MKKLIALVLAVAMSLTFMVVGVTVGIIETGRKAAESVGCAVGTVLVTPANIVIGGASWTKDVLGTVAGGAWDIVTGDLFSDSPSIEEAMGQEQFANAAWIAGIGLNRGRSDREIAVAINKAASDSEFQNINFGPSNRLGLMQMPHSVVVDGVEYWGTQDQLMDPLFAINRFYTELETLTNRDDQTIAELTASVVGPTIDEDARERYEENEELAEYLAEYLTRDAIDSVAVVGGSLTQDMSASLTLNMQQSRWREVVINTETGRLIQEAEESESLDGVEAIELIRDQENPPDLYVIDLGTADLPYVKTTEDADDLITAIMKATPDDSQVVWVNTYVPAWSSATDIFNDALRARENQSSQTRISEINWGGYVASHPDLMQADGIHYTVDGNAQRAAFVVYGIEAALAEPDPSHEEGSKYIDGCGLGRSVAGKAFDLVVGEIGSTFMGGSDEVGAEDASLLDWAMDDTGFVLGDTPRSSVGGTILNPVPGVAKPGDILYWADDPEGTTITQRGMYIGNGTAVIEPKPGQIVAMQSVNWDEVHSIVRFNTVSSYSTANGGQAGVKISGSSSVVAGNPLSLTYPNVSDPEGLAIAIEEFVRSTNSNSSWLAVPDFAQKLVTYSQEVGVNPLLIVVLGRQESQFGASRIARANNNSFGNRGSPDNVGDPDGNGGDGWRDWPSIEASLVGPGSFTDAMRGRIAGEHACYTTVTSMYEYISVHLTGGIFGTDSPCGITDDHDLEDLNTYFSRATSWIGEMTGFTITGSPSQTTATFGPSPEGVFVHPNIPNVSNPRLAQVAAAFESSIGQEVLYGTPSQKWLDRGRRGTFGHGGGQRWIDDLSKGSAYYSLDCSGFVNVSLYIAYGVEFTSCSHGFKNASMNGGAVTVPVMENAIDPAILRPGDFIIKHDRGCLSGSNINHIVVVVSVNGSSITTSESHAGQNDGVEVRTKDASWYNSNWPDLVVSRWVGPGSQLG